MKACDCLKTSVSQKDFHRWKVSNSYSLTPTDASVTVLLEIEAAKNLELRHLGCEREFFQAHVDVAININFPGGYQAFTSALEKLNKTIYVWVQGWGCWNTKLAGYLRYF